MNEGENIRHELKSLAPEIQWNLRSPEFSVPEDYFQQSSRQIVEKIGLQEAEKILSKAPAYRVPPGYFNALPQQVLERIRKNKGVVSLPRYRRHRQQWAVAAAMAVIVTLGGLLAMPRSPKALDPQLATISDGAIEQYLHTQLSSLNTEEIYDYLNPEGQQHSITDGFSAQDIEEYLDNNVYTPEGL